MKKLLLILLTLSLSLSTFSLTACNEEEVKYADATADATYTQADAIAEVAYAFYRQGLQQNFNHTMSRQNINPSPEDATSQRQLYVDCSSFANAIFYEAFGMNIIADGVPIVKDGVTYDSLTPQTYNTQMYAEQYYGKDPAVLGVWKKGEYTE